MTRKSINKRILWLIIWTTVAGVAKMASTEKGKEQIKSVKDKLIDKVGGVVDFVQDGLKEMRKTSEKKNETKKE